METKASLPSPSGANVSDAKKKLTASSSKEVMEMSQIQHSNPSSSSAASNEDTKIRKRRLSNANVGDTEKIIAKKFITANEYDNSPSTSNQSNFNLLEFSDEMLLEVFLHCDTLTLYALTK